MDTCELCGYGYVNYIAEDFDRKDVSGDVFVCGRACVGETCYGDCCFVPNDVFRHDPNAVFCCEFNRIVVERDVGKLHMLKNVLFCSPNVFNRAQLFALISNICVCSQIEHASWLTERVGLALVDSSVIRGDYQIAGVYSLRDMNDSPDALCDVKCHLRCALRKINKLLPILPMTRPPTDFSQQLYLQECDFIMQICTLMAPVMAEIYAITPDAHYLANGFRLDPMSRDNAAVQYENYLVSSQSLSGVPLEGVSSFIHFMIKAINDRVLMYESPDMILLGKKAAANLLASLVEVCNMFVIPDWAADDAFQDCGWDLIAFDEADMEANYIDMIADDSDDDTMQSYEESDDEYSDD